MIKRQKMLLPFEISSDLSEEARLVDEIRNIGLKDEGRLTYAEMLMAFRRSQGIRRSTASSHDLTDSDTDDVTTDDSSHDIFLTSQLLTLEDLNIVIGSEMIWQSK